jgi:hypothetical protein
VAKNLFIVTIRWVHTPLNEANIKRIDDTLTQFGDWLRFSGFSWIVDTDRNADEIFRALGQFMHKDDSELIVRLDLSDWSGWCFPWVDAWLRSKKK